MSSLSTEIIEKAIDHAIKKNIERERNQIFQDGKAKGKIEGKIEEKERIAKTLKEYHTPEEISKITGLSIETEKIIKKYN